MTIWPRKTSWSDEMPPEVELSTRADQVAYELARLSVDIGRWSMVKYLFKCILKVLRHGRINNKE